MDPNNFDISQIKRERDLLDVLTVRLDVPEEMRPDEEIAVAIEVFLNEQYRAHQAALLELIQNPAEKLNPMNTRRWVFWADIVMPKMHRKDDPHMYHNYHLGCDNFWIYSHQEIFQGGVHRYENRETAPNLNRNEVAYFSRDGKVPIVGRVRCLESGGFHTSPWDPPYAKVEWIRYIDD